MDEDRYVVSQCFTDDNVASVFVWSDDSVDFEDLSTSVTFTNQQALAAAHAIIAHFTKDQPK